MMKRYFKILIIVLMLLQTACNQTVDFSGSPKEFSYTNNDRVDYGLAQNSAGLLRTIEPIETGIYFWISYQTKAREVVGLLGFYDFTSEQAHIVNSNVSEACTLEQPEKCSSFFKGLVTLNGYLRAYQDKLYYYDSELNLSNDQHAYGLYQMDLDGTNRKKIVDITPDFQQIPKDYVFEDNQSLSISVHQHYLYYTYGYHGVMRVNLQNYKQELILEAFALSKIKHLFFNEDDVFLVSDYFNPTTGLIESPSLYKYSLSHKTIEKISLNNQVASISYVDNQSLIYINEVNNTILRNNAQEVLLSSGPVSIYQTQTGFFIESLFGDDESDQFILINKKGDVLSTKTFDKKYSFRPAQGVVGDYYYTTISEGNTTSFVRIPIGDNTIQNFEVLFTYRRQYE